MSTSDRRGEVDLDRDDDPLNEDEKCEQVVLHMLLCDETHSLWSLDEIAAAFKADPGNATDGVHGSPKRGLCIASASSRSRHLLRGTQIGLAVKAYRAARAGSSSAGRPADDERTAEMCRLRLVEGLTLGEIAERYGVGAERVRQLVSRHLYRTTGGRPVDAKAISRAAVQIRREKDLARSGASVGDPCRLGGGSGACADRGASWLAPAQRDRGHRLSTA